MHSALLGYIMNLFPPSALFLAARLAAACSAPLSFCVVSLQNGAMYRHRRKSGYAPDITAFGGCCRTYIPLASPWFMPSFLRRPLPYSQPFGPVGLESGENLRRIKHERRAASAAAAAAVAAAARDMDDGSSISSISDLHYHPRPTLGPHRPLHPNVPHHGRGYGWSSGGSRWRPQIGNFRRSNSSFFSSSYSSSSPSLPLPPRPRPRPPTLPTYPLEPAVPASRFGPFGGRWPHRGSHERRPEPRRVRWNLGNRATGYGNTFRSSRFRRPDVFRSHADPLPDSGPRRRWNSRSRAHNYNSAYDSDILPTDSWSVQSTGRSFVSSTDSDSVYLGNFRRRMRTPRWFRRLRPNARY